MSDIVLLVSEEEFFEYMMTEAQEHRKLNHLDHLEDLALTNTAKGTHDILDILHDLHGYLSGNNRGMKLSTKYDGAPSIIAGRHPVNGDFFVSTKSLFNKSPKINYSPEDVDKNHGSTPGLSKKMKEALEHLPKVMPDRGIYQGDLMYGDGDVEEKGKNLEFTPNTITYRTLKGSAMAQIVKGSRMGVVFHTKYSGTDIGNMSASPIDNLDNFKHHPDVNVIDPGIHGKIDYSPADQRRLVGCIKKIATLNADLAQEGYAKLENQAEGLKRYINAAVKEGKDPSPEGYMVFIKQNEIKDVSKLKTPAYKKAKSSHYDALMQRVAGDADTFGTLLKIHKEVQNAKKIVLKSLASTSSFEHHIDGKKTGPEGFVGQNGSGTNFKLVDRADFSKKNFDNKKFEKSDDNPMIFAFGRMNPPTAGHGKLVDMVQDLAKNKKAAHLIVMSRGQDPDKNPLNPDQKLSYAKKMFPGANIDVAKEGENSIIKQMQKLSDKGIKHVIIVAGSDRVKDFKKIVDKCNGTQFYIPKLEVVSAGDRDEKDDKIAGQSGTKMRAHAADGNFDKFSKGITKHMSLKDARNMYDDVRNSQKKEPLISHKTPTITLSRYSKRPKDDKLGNQARMEIEKRKRMGIWAGG